MKISLSISTVLLFLIASFTLNAQERDQRRETEERNSYSRQEAFGIGISLGLHQFTGDVQDQDGGFFEGAENSLLFGGNIFAKYRVGGIEDIGTLHLLGKAGYHPMDGKLNSGEDVYEFENDGIVIGVGVQLEILPQSDIRPFGNIGVGLLIHDPTITTEGKWTRRYEIYKGEGTTTGAIPVDLGLLFKVSDAIDLTAFVNKTIAFSDNLDGWESNINDNWQSFNLGLVYYFGEEKEEVVEEYVPPTPKDTDGDGLMDDDETATYKTDPNNPDSDNDGLKDGAEVRNHKTNPLNPDTDADGLQDGEEVTAHRTDPLNPDSDGDGCNDGDEVRAMKTNPLQKDTDGDGLTDCDEINIHKTNPLIADTDGDGANDGRELAVGTDPLVPDVLKVEEGKDLVLEGINFETAKATILPESEPILTKALNTLRVNADLRVEIQGHTDDRGRNSYNQRLSEARANSVRTWLVERGIDGNRMTAVGFGEDQPMVSNDNAENRARNRRIQFKVIK